MPPKVRPRCDRRRDRLRGPGRVSIPLRVWPHCNDDFIEFLRPAMMSQSPEGSELVATMLDTGAVLEVKSQSPEGSDLVATTTISRRSRTYTSQSPEGSDLVATTLGSAVHGARRVSIPRRVRPRCNSRWPRSGLSYRRLNPPKGPTSLQPSASARARNEKESQSPEGSDLVATTGVSAFSPPSKSQSPEGSDLVATSW